MTDSGSSGRSRRSDKVRSPEPAGPLEDRGKRFPRSLSLTVGTVIKLLFLAAVNLLAVWSIPSMWSQKWWPGLIAVVVATVLLDWAYLSPRAIPAKYLVPGTIFALIFAVVPVIYNAFIAFTNFGTGNVLTREQAVDSITDRVSNVPGSTRFDLTLLAADDGAGEFALLLEDEAGNQFLGTADDFFALAPTDIETNADGKVLGVGDFVALNLGQIADRQQELVDFEVVSDEGTIKVLTVTSAAVYEPLYRYDEATGTVTDMETGVVYAAVEGTFTSPDGDTINPGYRAFIGWDNFTRILTSEAIRGPFLRVFIWNYAFAILSVLTTFALGLGLAITLNHPKIVINDMLNASIPWLRDPWMAKGSVLLVNLWLGFPYMFLIATGALQAIPAELKDAARVDGAGSRQIFRRVTFPLLLITLAPLLIASFAFNFNNFNIIFLLTEGGPPIAGAQTPAGHTDILISYTYRLAFESGSGSDFGFAAAIASLIFFMVATISALSFRRTRVLEELS